MAGMTVTPAPALAPGRSGAWPEITKPEYVRTPCSRPVTVKSGSEWGFALPIRFADLHPVSRSCPDFTHFTDFTGGANQMRVARNQ